jgi:hypothetical protein
MTWSLVMLLMVYSSKKPSGPGTIAFKRRISEATSWVISRGPDPKVQPPEEDVTDAEKAGPGGRGPS